MTKSPIYRGEAEMVSEGDQDDRRTGLNPKITLLGHAGSFQPSLIKPKWFFLSLSLKLHLDFRHQESRFQNRFCGIKTQVKVEQLLDYLFIK